jgi:hypothetical protein
MPKIRVAKWKVLHSPPRGERLIIQDTRGRLWQRFDDMPSGQWGEFELPDEPAAERKPRVRRR